MIKYYCDICNKTLEYRDIGYLDLPFRIKNIRTSYEICSTCSEKVAYYLDSLKHGNKS